MDDNDIKDQEDWLNQITFDKLSNKSLTIASKIARKIKSENGVIVRLQDKAIATCLAEQVIAIDDDELNALFRIFLEEALFNSNNNANQASRRKTTGSYRGVKVEH